MVKKDISVVAAVIVLVGVPLVCGQLNVINVLQCSNLLSGVCRQQCQTDELIVYPSICSFYSAVYGVGLKRCVTSMPCCYWYGSCRTSCGKDEVQLTSAARCSSGGNVCCVPKGLVRTSTPVATTPVPMTTMTTGKTTAADRGHTVSSRQGVCGYSVPAPSKIVTFPARPRLIGGRVAKPLDWPWVVRLTFRNTIGFCAGVLVNHDTVITVAHCVAGVDVGTMRVILADYDLSTFDTGEEVVGVSKYFFSGRYTRRTRGRDLAVVKLSRNITYTDRKLPVCLPDASIPLKRPSTCYIAGWGVSEEGLGGAMRTVNVQLLDKRTCQRRVSTRQRRPESLPSDILCTNNPVSAPSDGCLFDDGDMLVCRDTQKRWSLIGVMSEYSCGDGLPMLFTDVRKYTDVILDRL